VRRKVVSDHMDLLAVRLIGDDIGEEGDELGRCVPGAVANCFHLVNFRSRKFDFEHLLNSEHQPNVGQAVPSVHVFGRKSRSRAYRIIIEEVLNDFR
jgi:hypothetical protein